MPTLTANADAAVRQGYDQKLVTLLNDPALTLKERAKGGAFRLKTPTAQALQAFIGRVAALIEQRREILGPMEKHERRTYLHTLNDSQPD